MAEEQNLSIFNIGENADIVNEAMFNSREGSNMFDPRVKNVGDSTSFIIRPVPYIEDILHSKIRKFFYAVPNGQATAIFDSPTTFNNPATGEFHFCPVSDIWAMLKNAQDPNTQKMAELLRRQVGIYAYVCVVNYPDDPSLNGKIMPMKLPIDLDKVLDGMSKPTEAQIKLGKKGIQPFDIIGGCDITATITGHKPYSNAPVMRKWTFDVEKPSPLQLPLGANGDMVPVTDVAQEKVVEYFKSQQTVNLAERFGYSAPNNDIKIATYRWLQASVGMIPGIREKIDANFKDILPLIQQQNVGGMQAPADQGIQTQHVSFGAPVQQAPQAQQPQPAQAAQPAQAQTQPQGSLDNQPPQAEQQKLADPVPTQAQAQQPQPAQPAQEAQTQPVPETEQAPKPVEQPQQPEQPKPVEQPQQPEQPKPAEQPQPAAQPQPAETGPSGIKIP